jgi:hypothetical protein
MCVPVEDVFRIVQTLAQSSAAQLAMVGPLGLINFKIITDTYILGEHNKNRRSYGLLRCDTHRTTALQMSI